MKINVQVKLNSKKQSVQIDENGIYVVRVNARPVDGKANERVQELLAEFFKCGKSSVILVSGHKSKSKTFEIL